MIDMDDDRMKMDGLEGRTDRENIIALFYEVRQSRIDVRQARIEFQKHIDEDREAFKDIRDSLKDIKTTIQSVNIYSTIASRLVHGVGWLIGGGGLATLILKHVIGS